MTMPTPGPTGPWQPHTREHEWGSVAAGIANYRGDYLRYDNRGRYGYEPQTTPSEAGAR